MILFAQVQGRAVGKGIALGAGIAGVCAGQLRPTDADGRVIPGKTTFVTGVVEIGAFVAEFRGVGQHQ